VILEVPEVVMLPDGTTAAVKGVAASVVDGRLERVIYTIEKASGGWAEVDAAAAVEAGAEGAAEGADGGGLPSDLAGAHATV
jgi:hypothetical protein